jgi:hypothetical protein
MKQFTWIPKILLSGLLLAQMLFLVPVYQSNLHLFHTTTAIDAAGYLAIPNLKILPALKTVATAFMGGLFFTFTLGAGLTISTFACAWAWDRLLGRQKRFLLLFAIPWWLCLIALNSHGLILSASAAFFLVPPAVFFLTLKWMPKKSAKNPLPPLLLRLAPLVVLAIAWLSLSGTNIFINVRDVFLLSNPAGIAINNFYYRYTLYPARVFKTLDQKTLKTCHLENIDQKPLQKQLEDRLLRYDYLPVDHFEQVDLALRKETNFLIFKDQGREIFRCPMGEFIARPGSQLKKFSSALDSYSLLRQLTFISLLAGLPVLVYTLTLCLLQILFFLAGLPPGRSLTVSLGLILIAGLVLPACLSHFSGRATPHMQNPIQALGSRHLHIRVAALKTIAAKHLNITDYQHYKTILESPHIAERYWAARALGAGRDLKSSKDLLALLDDPHPNVVCQAFYALGQNNGKTVIPEILNRIKASDHWYVQWYAYRAARKLKWKQTALR